VFGSWLLMRMESISSRGKDFDEVLPPVHERVYPTLRGRRLSYIPFFFINTNTTWPDCRKPPALDIAYMNLSHYQNYGLLESARYFSATPIYYAKGQGIAASASPVETSLNADGTSTHVRKESAPVFQVGANAIWLLDKDDDCGIIEYSGSGLSSLEQGLLSKETQMQSLGAKLVGQNKGTASKSALSEDLIAQGEEAVLLKLVQTLSSGLTTVLKEVTAWTLADSSSVEVTLNEQFNRPKIGAREIRSLVALFNAGLSPEKSTYSLLQEAGLLTADVTLEDFEATVEEYHVIKTIPSVPTVSPQNKATKTSTKKAL